MWDGLFTLLFLCLLMATASFLAGMLPLYFSLSSRQLRLMTALGTGVLVGTALIVIIPEGVETLYSASGSSHSHIARDVPSLATRSAMGEGFLGSLKHDTWRREITAVPIYTGASSEGLAHMEGVSEEGFDVGKATTKQEQNKAEHDTNDDHEDKDNDAEDDDQESNEEEHSNDPHAWVGVSLITGFILMYLIDTLPKQATSSSHPQRFHISLHNLSFNRSASMNSTNLEEPPTPTGASHSHNHSQGEGHSRPSSTTLGLVIHAIADGIALGASSATSTSGTSRLSFIIFVALMIHKAPAAFGLTSVLLKQGLGKRAARSHLVVFSLAAPVGALLTWFAAHLLGYSSKALSNSMSTEFATGVLLLFSGGTFLYVAVHVMQESGHGHGEQQAQGNGYVSVPGMDMYDERPPAGQRKGEGKEGFTDTVVTVVGMLIPLLTQFGHVH